MISPLLANLFLHYAFDVWMARKSAHILFERYADDIICHCKSAGEARALSSAIADRLAACKSRSCVPSSSARIKARIACHIGGKDGSETALDGLLHGIPR